MLCCFVIVSLLVNSFMMFEWIHKVRVVTCLTRKNLENIKKVQTLIQTILTITATKRLFNLRQQFAVFGFLKKMLKR
jgi:hypothetical protein